MGPGGGPSRPWPATVGEEEEEGSATRGTAAAGAHPLLAAATIGRSGSSERLHPMPRSPHLRLALPSLSVSLAQPLCLCLSFHLCLRAPHPAGTSRSARGGEVPASTTRTRMEAALLLLYRRRQPQQLSSELSCEHRQYRLLVLVHGGAE